MIKKSMLYVLFLVVLAFGSSLTVIASDESLDVTEGWEILEYSSSQPNILVEDVVKQGVYIAATNQKVILSQFANIGKANLAAKKEIFLKKDHVYSLNLMYAMQYNAGSGYIDFNGERIEDDSNYQDQNFQRVIKPREDMIYTIKMGFDVKQNSNGYWKIGYDVNDLGIEAVQSKVITRSLDLTGKLIQSSEKSNAIGEVYSTFPEVIEGYVLDESQLPQNETGIFTEANQTVDYIYQPILPSAADVIINYVDVKGNTIHDPQRISGEFGESYDASLKEYQLAIEGYNLDKNQLPENREGTISDQEQVVTYTYIKDITSMGTVIVKYLDQTGKEINPQQMITDKVGIAYDVSTESYRIKLKQYTLDKTKLPNNETGFFTKDVQTVSYIYIENPVEDLEGSENSKEPDDSEESKKVEESKSSMSSEKKDQRKKHKLLPQTGEKKSVISWLVGGMFILMRLLVIFLQKKLSNKVTNSY